MKLKLHHPTSHPYWQRNKFRIEKESGEFVDCWKYSKYNGNYGEEYEIKVKEDGIYVQYFLCSSGGGKRPSSEEYLLISSTDYTEIEYVGKPLIISETLRKDIQSQGY